MPIATSLPELVEFISALRIDSTDLAVGNLLGSNLFNMLILSIDDMASLQTPHFEQVHTIHALRALVAILMTTVAGMGVLFEQPIKSYKLGVSARVLCSYAWRWYSFYGTTLS